MTISKKKAKIDITLESVTKKDKERKEEIRRADDKYNKQFLSK